MKTIRFTFPQVPTRYKYVGPKAKAAAPKAEEPKKSPKTGGNPRQPHAGKAVDCSGSIAGWEHGHYDYDNDGD